MPSLESLYSSSERVFDLTREKQPLQGPLRGHLRSFSQVLKASIERQEQTRGWCDRCRRYQSLATRKTVQSVPDVLLLNAAVHRAEAAQYWAAPGWLPDEIGLSVEGGQLLCYEGDDLKMRLEREHDETVVYELVGVVAEIDSGERQASHLVSLVNGEFVICVLHWLRCGVGAGR